MEFRGESRVYSVCVIIQGRVNVVEFGDELGFRYKHYGGVTLCTVYGMGWGLIHHKLCR